MQLTCTLRRARRTASRALRLVRDSRATVMVEMAFTLPLLVFVLSLIHI